jgi:hypothetical protein
MKPIYSKQSVYGLANRKSAYFDSKVREGTAV